MYRYKEKRKQQALLLLLLLFAATQGMWGQTSLSGDITKMYGYQITGDNYILNGVTNGVLSFPGRVPGGTHGRTVTITLNGSTNTLRAHPTNYYYKLAPIDMHGEYDNWEISGNTINLVATRPSVLNALGGDINLAMVPGLDITGSIFNVKGPLKLTSFGSTGGYRAPGIGAKFVTTGDPWHSSHKWGNGGALHVSGGARVAMNEDVDGKNYEMLPYLYIDDFATFNVFSGDINSAFKSPGKTEMADRGNIKNGKLLVVDFSDQQGYSKPTSGEWEEVRFFSNGSETTSGLQLYMEYYNTNTFSFYSENSRKWDYFKIGGIPSGPETSGSTYVGLYGVGNKKYAVFGSHSSGTILLNASKYTVSGTLTATGGIVFDGNRNNPSFPRTFYPTDPIFQTNGGNLRLTNIYAPSVGNGSTLGLRLKGQVYIAKGDNSNSFATGLVKDASTNVPIYHNIVELDQDHTIQKITYGNTLINSYHVIGKTLYLWLPVGTNQNLRIETNEGVIYTATASVAATHRTSESILIDPTEYDLAKQSLTLTTATSGSNQTVTFGGKPYTLLAQSPLIFFSTAQSANTITMTGKSGEIANVTFKDLKLSSTNTCLKIDGGITTNVTLATLNTLATSAQYCIDVANGKLTFKKASAGSLSANSTHSSSRNDININSSSGFVTLEDGNYSIRSVSSTFKPQNLSISGTLQPKIYMGQTDTSPYYLGVLSNKSYGFGEYRAQDGNVLDTKMYADDGGNIVFWMRDNQILGVSSGKEYLISRTSALHNQLLTITAIIAKIGTKSYGSLATAFAEVVPNGEIVMYDTYALVPGESPYLQNIPKGQKATLNLNTLVVTGAEHLLNLNGGILEITTQTGTLAGSFKISNGGLYSTAGDNTFANATIQMQKNVTDWERVYRARVSSLATGISNYIYYKQEGTNNSYRAAYATGGNTCIWLPAAVLPTTALLADGTNATPEPVSEAILVVTNDHASTAVAEPAPHIDFGNITFTDGSSSGIKVTYGSKPFTQDNMSLSDTKRVRLRGINKDKANQIIVRSGNDRTAYFSFSNIRSDVGIASGAAMLVEGKADVMLEKANNELRGGRGGGLKSAAITVEADASLIFCNNDADKGIYSGELLAQGAVYGSDYGPSVLCNGNGMLTIKGGTLRMLNGDEDQLEEAVKGTIPMQFLGGSLNTRAQTRPQAKTIPVYLVTVSTGLTPGKPYRYTYTPGEAIAGYTPPKDTYVVPNADSKIYVWLPEMAMGKPHGNIELTDPETASKKSVPITLVAKNDNNVAPIVINLTDTETLKSQSFGNLKDAFDAITAGTAGKRKQYQLDLLTNVSNVRTQQMVKEYCDVTFNLNSFNVEMVSGSGVSFEANETSFLHITGTGGNIRNSFKLAGDVFINGIVPLTDATLERGGQSVFRTLISELPSGADNNYMYVYGKQQEQFKVHTINHNGKSTLLACLWLPDNGQQMEVRITVNSPGSSVEYTTGPITTKTQATEPMPVNAVGVVASVNYASTNQAFNTLSGALNQVKVANSQGYDETNEKPVKVNLLAGSTFASHFTIEGQCQLNLAGKNLLCASGAKVIVKNATTRLRFFDQSVGVKGALQVDIVLPDPLTLCIPSYIQLTGNVTDKAEAPTKNYWRTLLNISYMPEVVQVEYNGVKYPVIGGEVCLWLEKDASGKEYLFTLRDKTGSLVGDNAGVVAKKDVVISENHQNEITLGTVDYEARISTVNHKMIQEALNAAVLGNTVELLKTIAPITSLKVDNKEILLELGKYGIERQIISPAEMQIDGNNARMEIRSTHSGTGRLLIDTKMTNGGLLFAGLTIGSDKLGAVYDGTTQKYRLLVKNLPKGMPDDVYTYTYGSQTGSCMVRSSVACLWLTEQKSGRSLTFKAGTAEYTIQNVLITANHTNVETYGVNDVAQVQNGAKYTTLSEAFAAGAGKKIILLKNASLDQGITVSEKNTQLDMATFNIASADLTNTPITITPTGSLQISGRGNLYVNFKIERADQTFASNGNLIVDQTVSINTASDITMNGASIKRTNVSGLPSSSLNHYQYAAQEGDVTSSPTGTLCLWLKDSSTPQTFRVDIGDKTWLLPSVVVNSGHSTQVTVAPREAVAQINGNSYDTLEQAFAAVKEGETILLSKNTENSTELKVPDGLTKVSFNLNKKKLTWSLGAKLDANAAQLVLAGGIVEGDMELSGKLFAGGDVRMNNLQITKENRTVWRTLLMLPVGTTTIDYQQGAASPVNGYDNMQPLNGTDVMACLWLPAANLAQDILVKAGGNEYRLANAVIAPTHGNELNVAGGSAPEAMINTTAYASLSSALAMAKAGDVIVLQKSVSPSTVLDVKEDVTINLNSQTITSTNSGFSVANNKKLKLVNSGTAPVALVGTFQLPGKGVVDAGSDVKIAGVVQNEKYEEIFRVGVEVKGVKQCLWLLPSEVEYDETILSGSETWEVAVPIALNNHNTTLKAYQRIELSGDVTWNASTQANANIVIKSTGVWTIASGTNGTIHRLTIEEGGKVKAEGQVTATEGIRYVRTFVTTGQWASIALPFTTTRIITTKTGMTKPASLTPASSTGTMGDFWLYTMQVNGQQQAVNTSQLEGNVSYILAISAAIKDLPITFISGGQQVLRRNKIQALVPMSGFASYANGTLDEITVKDQCYVLNPLSNEYERQSINYVLPPFHGYLLADLATTQNTPSLRLDMPTHTESIRPMDRMLKVFSRPGVIVVESSCEMWIQIHTFSGYCIQMVRIPVGYTEFFVHSGYYIVNGQKVVVR